MIFLLLSTQKNDLEELFHINKFASLTNYTYVKDKNKKKDDRIKKKKKKKRMVFPLA